MEETSSMSGFETPHKKPSLLFFLVKIAFICMFYSIYINNFRSIYFLFTLTDFSE
jgi:hypothetical protein